MYFSYLRGRQFELIAIRELVEQEVMNKDIIPIIEPVKLSSTLIKTIQVFSEHNRTIGIIYNPMVGNFTNDIKEEKNQKLKEGMINAIKDNENILFIYLLKQNSDPSIFIMNHREKMATICLDKDSIPIYEKYFIDENERFNLIPDESGFRRKIRQNRVLFDDKFNKQERNNDYIDIDDEPFSEDHLYYLEDGYVGFADYSVVGNEYSDTGFAPYAVAIHIVYFDTDKSLRIRHFVSDSNDDISDPAGKFQEALTKLVEWNKEKQLQTVAMSMFEDLFKREAYPGLGTVKKLSIMHHLELIGKYLDEE